MPLIVEANSLPLAHMLRLANCLTERPVPTVFTMLPANICPSNIYNSKMDDNLFSDAIYILQCTMKPLAKLANGSSRQEEWRSTGFFLLAALSRCLRLVVVSVLYLNECPSSKCSSTCRESRPSNPHPKHKKFTSAHTNVI